jgi:thiol-disulfide isomerase/thioredoxin
VDALKKRVGLSLTSNELLVKNKEGEEFEFENIINKENKILYVDFWASWCAPCRSVMKDAELLRQKYANKDVAFIYLAINDQEEKWLEASLKEKLNDLKHNYIITNSKSSKLLNDLNITKIPRYVIYNKNGKLIYHNAPGPNDRGLIQILDKYLNTE